jgi:hypothetical protein
MYQLSSDSPKVLAGAPEIISLWDTDAEFLNSQLILMLIDHSP